MSRECVNRYCATLPSAEVSDPWGGGHDAWKVGGRMFACVGALDIGVSVKTPDVETAELLIEAGHAERAPYFHRSWILVPWAKLEDGTVTEGELMDRLRAAYEIIRAKLPKKVQAELG